MSKAKKKTPDNVIAQNRKARYDHFIEDTLEAGLVLEGWEVKSLREGRGQLTESYVVVRRNEVWLVGLTITPLLAASTHINPDPLRSRKMLLNRSEIDKLIGYVERDGYTLLALSLHWKRGRVKCLIGYAKGKKQHDKRAVEKDRDWQRDKQRLMKR